MEMRSASHRGRPGREPSARAPAGRSDRDSWPPSEAWPLPRGSDLSLRGGRLSVRRHAGIVVDGPDRRLGRRGHRSRRSMAGPGPSGLPRQGGASGPQRCRRRPPGRGPGQRGGDGGQRLGQAGSRVSRQGRPFHRRGHTPPHADTRSRSPVRVRPTGQALRWPGRTPGRGVPRGPARRGSHVLSGRAARRRRLQNAARHFTSVPAAGTAGRQGLFAGGAAGARFPGRRRGGLLAGSGQGPEPGWPACSWRVSSCSCRTRRMPARFRPSAVSAQISWSRSMALRDTCMHGRTCHGTRGLTHVKT